METLSDRYGWTPDEIRMMDAGDVAAYVAIINLKSDIEKAHALKQGA
ncbi:MAG: hypothetical protein WC483_03795 [Candidatus Paceibacterota bacterium]